MPLLPGNLCEGWEDSMLLHDTRFSAKHRQALPFRQHFQSAAASEQKTISSLALALCHIGVPLSPGPMLSLSVSDMGL